MDGDSKGFEHATAAADLDGDGRAELYVASDDDKEIRRYVWSGSRFERETIYARPGRRLDPDLEPDAGAGRPDALLGRA